MVAVNYNTFFDSKSVTSTTTGAGADVIHTVPANHDCEIDFLVATNGGSVQNISVLVYHADDTVYHYIIRAHSVAGNDTYKVVEADRIYLHAGDKIVAYKGSSSGTFDVSVSGRQFYNPVRSI